MSITPHPIDVNRKPMTLPALKATLKALSTVV